MELEHGTWTVGNMEVTDVHDINTLVENKLGEEKMVEELEQAYEGIQR